MPGHQELNINTKISEVVYSQTFNSIKKKISQFVLKPPNRPSSSSIIVKLDNIILKIPNVELFPKILKSQKRKKIVDFIIHERQASIAARSTIENNLAFATLPKIMDRQNVSASLYNIGLRKSQAEIISAWTLGYTFLPGNPLGYYNEEFNKYIYDRKTVLKYKHNLIEGFQKVLKVVIKMNANGVYHNDLAPQNIIIGNTSGHYKGISIIDFGASYLDYKTDWEQPSIEFIDLWYSKKLSTPNLHIRSNEFKLRNHDVSKDISDIELHINNLQSIIEK